MSDKALPRAHVVPIWRPDADGNDVQRFAVLAEPWPLTFLGSFDTRAAAELRASAFEAKKAKSTRVSTPFDFWCAVAHPREVDAWEWQLWGVSALNGIWHVERGPSTGIHPDVANPPTVPVSIFVDLSLGSVLKRTRERRSAQAVGDDGRQSESTVGSDGSGPTRRLDR